MNSVVLLQGVVLCAVCSLAVSERAAYSDGQHGDPTGLTRRRRAKSHFRVGPHWETMSFDERWADFQSGVPASRFQGSEHPGFIPDGENRGLSCVPWLWGPEDAENLLILVHGFLMCPGRWGLLVKELQDREVVCGLPTGKGPDAPRPCGRYRIMGVTLPGHGYKWAESPASVVSVENNSTVQVSRTDDIEDMPFDKKAWYDFNEALGSLAQKFKEEHPHGTVAINGHSIGAMMSMQIAVSRPTVFDRVLIQNPELGPSAAYLWVVGPLFKHLRLSINVLADDCEGERAPGSDYSGGYCQFKLGNINSVWSFSKEVYCKSWQIARCTMTGWRFDQKAFDETRRNFSLIKSFQMIATRGDHAVEEKRILKFMEAFHDARGGDLNSGLCTFPEVMGHTYLVPNYVHNHRGGERWWAPYAMKVLVQYLTEGRTVPVVFRSADLSWKQTDRHGSPIGHFLDPATRSELQRDDWCMPTSPSGVVGTDLTILPAAQNERGYFVTRVGGQRTFVQVLYAGPAEKRIFNSSVWYNRWEEVVVVNGDFLFVGRENKDAVIRELYLIHKSGRTISDKCVEIPVDQLDPQQPLLEEIEKRHSSPVTVVKKYCAKVLVEKFCDIGVATCTR